jgi:hypothetical protein
MKTKYYLSPESWSADCWRDVYTIEEIKNLPDEWCVDETDCICLGEFENVDAAIKYARENYDCVRP